MKYKGDFSNLTAYDKGDVVKGSDGVWYICTKDASAGSSVLNTDYFNKIADDSVRNTLDLLTAFDDRIYALEHPESGD